jgi:hypothetical protein
MSSAFDMGQTSLGGADLLSITRGYLLLALADPSTSNANFRGLGQLDAVLGQRNSRLRFPPMISCLSCSETSVLYRRKSTASE